MGLRSGSASASHFGRHRLRTVCVAPHASRGFLMGGSLAGASTVVPNTVREVFKSGVSSLKRAALGLGGKRVLLTVGKNGLA
jgi:hypothetical protein